jgi:hypothetical protein
MGTEAFTKGVRRYVHNQIVLPSPAGWEFDGIAELWFDDVASAVTYLEASREQQPAEDFDRGFTTMLEVSHLWVRRPAQQRSGR